MTSRMHHLLLSLLLALVFLVAAVVAQTIVSYNVPGTVWIVKPELNLKLFNDADGTEPCVSLSWTVATGESAELQAKYLKNVGSVDLNVWYTTELPSELNLTVSWYAIMFSNGEWTPAEKGSHSWAEGENVTLAVEKVIVVVFRLDVSDAADGYYAFALRFNGVEVSQ